MKRGSVELEIELIECSFNEKHRYYVSVSVDSPQPSSLPMEPGFENDSKKGEEKHVLLKTEEVGPSFEPRFLNNKFVFRVPSVVNQKKEFLVFSLNFEIFSVKHDTRGRVLKLIGSGDLQSNFEISQKLLFKKILSHLIYVHKEESDQLLGSVNLRLSLNVFKNEKKKMVVKKKPAELKLSNLVAELRKSSEIHLKVLSEANKFNDQNFSKFVSKLGEEMETKKNLIDRLLVELNQKSEIIDNYKYTLKEERGKFDVLEKESKNKDEIINELKQKENLIMNSNTSYMEIQKLQKRNLILLRRQQHLQELEKAHQGQSKLLLQFQKRVRRARHYKRITQKQELIIQKLERVLKTKYSESQSSGRSQGKKSKEQIIHELHNKSEELTDELKVKIDQIKSFEEELEIKNERMNLLESEIDLITKKSAREISMLRIKLANNGIDWNINENDFQMNFDKVPHGFSDEPLEIEKPKITKGQEKGKGYMNEFHNRLKTPSMVSIPLLPERTISELGSDYDDISLPQLSTRSIVSRDGSRISSMKDFQVGDEIEYDGLVNK